MDYSQFSDILDQFDSQTIGFSEASVSDKLGAFIGSKRPVAGDLLAEWMAFAFMENYQDLDGLGWGTWFGPMMQQRADDGTRYASPDIASVTDKTIEYWADRARESRHPVLVFRYAFLVWDFSKSVSGRRYNPDFARLGCDAAIQMTREALYEHDEFVVDKLKFALSVAASLRDNVRIDKLIDTVMWFEDSVAGGRKPWLIGLSYDLLVASKMPQLTAERESKIVTSLEQHLSWLADPRNLANSDPRIIEAIATRLAQYYRRRNCFEDLRRVMQTYAHTMAKLAEGVAPIIAAGWLQQTHVMLSQINQNALADETSKLLLKYTTESVHDFQEITYECSISNAEIGHYLDDMSNGSLIDCLERIAVHFVPDTDRVIENLRDQATRTPLQFLIDQTIVDHEGRPVACLGSLENDLDGHVVKRMSQDMTFMAMFLRMVLAKVFADHAVTCATFVDFLYLSPAFAPEKRPVIEAGIAAFLAQNWISAIHVLIPQVEDALRRVVSLRCGVTMKRGRNGGMQLRNLDELLRSDELTNLLNQDVRGYFRVLLSDPRGWNARNSVCHGILAVNSFTPTLADRVIHAFLVLAMLRVNEPQGKPVVDGVGGSGTGGAI